MPIPTLLMSRRLVEFDKHRVQINHHYDYPRGIMFKSGPLHIGLAVENPKGWAALDERTPTNFSFCMRYISLAMETSLTIHEKITPRLNLKLRHQ